MNCHGNCTTLPLSTNHFREVQPYFEVAHQYFMDFDVTKAKFIIFFIHPFTYLSHYGGFKKGNPTTHLMLIVFRILKQS